MSQSLDRRNSKSNFKVISDYKEPSGGTTLKFRWSVSAAHLASLEDNTSTIFPSIDTNRSQRKYFPASPSLRDQYSVSQSSVYTHKSLPLQNIAKQCQSPTSTEQDKSSPRSSPLSLSYAELHERPPSSLIKRRKQPRFSIYQAPDDKRDYVPALSRRLSRFSIYQAPDDQRDNVPAVSRRLSRILSPSTATISFLPTKGNRRLSNDNLVRLHTPQLRHLHVSEKYMSEAKKLYFDANCRSFVPRVVATTQVF